LFLIHLTTKADEKSYSPTRVMVSMSICCVRLGVALTKRLFAQVGHHFFNGLHFQFQLTQVSLQLNNLLGLGLIPALEMAAIAATFAAMAFGTATFPTAASFAAIASAILAFPFAITILTLMMFTVMTHVRLSFP
jgi:hypothetical protein